ncbi:hypothetical protein [Streptomyces sp. NPDC058755]|uniref:hypothetical protein n=1 Tax=Streptomyces sp. NPDC058755 TaxID=3346624 RepID=UPI0036C0A898
MAFTPVPVLAFGRHPHAHAPDARRPGSLGRTLWCGSGALAAVSLGTGGVVLALSQTAERNEWIAGAVST